MIISIFLLIIPILMSILSKVKVGSFKNPVLLVSLWWGGWAFLSTFGLLGLDVPSNKTYVLVLIFIIMFSTGALLVMGKSKVKIDRANPFLLKSTKRKLKILYNLQFIVLLLLIPYLIKTIPNILNMEASTYRLEIFNSDILYQSSNVRLLFDILIHPIISTGILLGIVGFLLGYRTKKILFVSILNGIVFSIMTLGRWYFLRIFFFLIIGYFLVSRHKDMIPRNIFKKNKKILSLLIPIASIAMIFMSSFRSQDGSSVLITAYEYVVRYFTGSFIALDQFLANFSNDISNFNFGRVTFTPVDTIFVYLIRRFDKSVVNITESISHYTVDFIHIGNGYTYNAFYTAIYSFYLDGGLFTVIVFSLVLGIIVGIVFNLYSKNPNLFTSSLLVFLIYLSMIATLRWEFINMWPLVVLIYLFILITKAGPKSS